MRLPPGDLHHCHSTMSILKMVYDMYMDELGGAWCFIGFPKAKTELSTMLILSDY